MQAYGQMRQVHLPVSTLSHPCSPMTYRKETDFLGTVEIPEEAYYGVHTVRAIENFPVSGFRVPEDLIRALADVKRACARANVKAGLLDERIAAATVRAATEVAEGGLADQFLTDAFQGGAGTSVNMNMNEVLANRAIELLGGRKGDYDLVDPLDHVNLSQSTNDVYPTALKVASIRLVLELAGEIALLQGSFQAKEKEFGNILKLGRTEMQDAVPMTLGQEFGAFADALARDRWRLFKVEERLRQVNLGGTAIGTGINAEKAYIYAAIEELQDITGLGVSRSENSVDVTQNADVFVEASGLVKAAAVNLAKIASDIRLLSAGPRGGIGEIRLRQLQTGSSIMPGKVNPVMTEMVTQVAFQVMCFDQATTMAASAGQLELNAFLPMVAFNLLTSMRMLCKCALLFRTRCIDTIEADAEKCRQWLEESRALATVLVPYIGYERAAELSRLAAKEGKNVRQAAVEAGLFTDEELDIVFAAHEVTRPGVAGARKLKGKKGTPPHGRSDAQ
jgi:aspartate ammonia-lyase